MSAERTDDSPGRVSVERHDDRLLVIITRRQTRAFSLSVPEAGELLGELLRQAPELARQDAGQQ
jgi:hypothetical protein